MTYLAVVRRLRLKPQHQLHYYFKPIITSQVFKAIFSLASN
jgi:hypothetical protein